MGINHKTSTEPFKTSSAVSEGRCISETGRNSFRLCDFPSTRFYGSKRKQLAWLASVLERFDVAKVLDACGGTGSVSLLLSNLGRRVTYNDVFRFNEISARALFLKGRAPSEAEITSFVDSIDPVVGTVAKNFSGIFFTDEENRWLDGAMTSLPTLEGELPRSVFLYCLFQACLKKRPFNLFHRANLGLRLSSHEVTFGNRTTWEKSFRDHIIQAYSELMQARSLVRSSVTVLPSGTAEKIKGKFDLVYLDPPYFNAHRSTESYSHRYHFLEGLARYSEWQELMCPISPIRQVTPAAVPGEWRDKVGFQQGLYSTIDRFRESTVALSYVADAYPDERSLCNFFESRFSRVKLYRQAYQRALSVRPRVEILIVGEP